jgi:hypothetical protein
MKTKMAEHVARTKASRGIYWFSVWKPKGRTLLGRPRRR